MRFTRPDDERLPIVGGVGNHVFARSQAEGEVKYGTKEEWQEEWERVQEEATEAVGYTDVPMHEYAAQLYTRLRAYSDVNDWYYGDLHWIARRGGDGPGYMRTAWFLLGELVGAGLLEVAFNLRISGSGAQTRGFDRPKQQDRKDILRASGGRHTSAEWEELKAAYDYRCLKCGQREPDVTLTKDHIIPVTLGGRDEIDNLQVLCGPCNTSKGTKVMDLRPFILGRPTTEE